MKMILKRQRLAWAVFGVLTLCLEPQKEYYEQKLAILAAQPPIQHTKICKYICYICCHKISSVLISLILPVIWPNSGDHIEVIAIDFDPTKITYLQLLDLFWNNHEYGLTTRVKRQYSSVIYYHSDEQKRIANESLDRERATRTSEEIITEILEAMHFFAAEE